MALLYHILISCAKITLYLAGWLNLSTPIAKLLYGLSTIDKGKGFGGTMYEEVKDDFSLFIHLY
jgi:hypothetical protein